ncbi:conserved Plasmodium protein, unknown function [Plasmodium sp. gorilla clade G3]|nr:conserved Plasmodium protein, unknown function [Plasmodium sp. gorilla clade G3]
MSMKGTKNMLSPLVGNVYDHKELKIKSINQQNNMSNNNYYNNHMNHNNSRPFNNNGNRKNLYYNTFSSHNGIISNNSIHEEKINNLYEQHNYIDEDATHITMEDENYKNYKNYEHTMDEDVMKNEYSSIIKDNNLKKKKKNIHHLNNKDINNTNINYETNEQVLIDLPKNHPLNKLTTSIIHSINPQLISGYTDEDINLINHKNHITKRINKVSTSKKKKKKKNEKEDIYENNVDNANGEDNTIGEDNTNDEDNTNGEDNEEIYKDQEIHYYKQLDDQIKKKQNKQNEQKKQYKEFDVYETKGYIPLSNEHKQNKSVCFVNNHVKYYAQQNNLPYEKNIIYENNLNDHQAHSYNNTLNQFTTNSDILNYDNNINNEYIQGIYNTNDYNIKQHSVYEPNEQVMYISPQEEKYIYMNASPNNIVRDNDMVFYSGQHDNQQMNININTHSKNINNNDNNNDNINDNINSSNSINDGCFNINLNNMNNIFNACTNTQNRQKTHKSFFCNSSRKNVINKDSNVKNNKTEILIYKNDRTNSYKNNDQIKKNIQNNNNGNNINKFNFFTPTSNNVFVRTRSLTPNTYQKKKKNSFFACSPLKDIKLNRQKSLPHQLYTTQDITAPIYTHDISYNLLNQNNLIQNDPYNNVHNITTTLSYPLVNSNYVQLYPYQNCNINDQIKKVEHFNVSKNYMNESSTQTPTETSSKSSKDNSLWNTQIHLLNEKIKNMQTKMENITKEKNKVNELCKMYKNECGRLRELLVKENYSKYKVLPISSIDYEEMNLKLEEENEKLRKQLEALGKTILASDDINSIKKNLAKHIVHLNEENEKYRNEIKLLKKNKDINNQILFTLNKTEVSSDMIDSIFMQTKNVIIEGHEHINVFYFNVKNLVQQFLEKMKYIIMENEYTKKEKLKYVVDLEDIIKKNFQEISQTVIKINNLRKNMKSIRAQVFDIDRVNPECFCKPSRTILENDIKQLEEVLHKHFILLKNLRKKNLSLNLNNLYVHFNNEDDQNAYSHESFNVSDEAFQMNKTYDNQDTNINIHQQKNISSKNLYEWQNKNNTAHAPNTQIERVEKDEKEKESYEEKNHKMNTTTEENNILVGEDTKVNEIFHEKLHEKIKIIEEQLKSLNNHIYCSMSENEEDDEIAKNTKKNNDLMDYKIKNNLKDKNTSPHIIKESLSKYETTTKKENVNYKSNKKQEGVHSKNASSYSSEISCSCEEMDGISSNEKDHWNNDDEVEKSKNKMIELLALLKGKHNEDLVENTKEHINSFGQDQWENKYNLKKIYNNLKAIKNTIKNTEDDTEKNILALIESQANDIKIFGNCIDDLKSTVAQ